jgi:hypothetical protein
MDTSVVAALRADSWELITVVVVAPEQVSDTYEAGWFAAFQRAGKALVLWSQEPLELM